MAVYQQYNSGINRSVWILLQPSVEGRRRFEEVQRRGCLGEHPMLFHVVLLFTAAVDWKDYLNYVRKEVDELVRIQPRIPNLTEDC